MLTDVFVYYAILLDVYYLKVLGYFFIEQLNNGYRYLNPGFKWWL